MPEPIYASVQTNRAFFLCLLPGFAKLDPPWRMHAYVHTLLGGGRSKKYEAKLALGGRGRGWGGGVICGGGGLSFICEVCSIILLCFPCSSSSFVVGVPCFLLSASSIFDDGPCCIIV